MIEEAIGIIGFVAEALEVPMTLCEMFTSADSPDPARQLGDSEVVCRISTYFERPVSQELLDYMKNLGRISSESAVAYKWALEQDPVSRTCN